MSSYYMNPRCSNLYLDLDTSSFLDPEDRAMCRAQVGYASSELHERMAQADTILVTASWRDWNVEFLELSFANIARHTSATLILIGRKHFGPISISRLLQIPEPERASLRLDASDGHIRTNERMRELALPFIDLHAVICGEGRTCPVFTQDLRLISHDGSHLTRDGAILVGQLLMQNSRFFRSLFGLDMQPATSFP